MIATTMQPLRTRDEVMHDLMLASNELEDAHRMMDDMGVPRCDLAGTRYPIANRLSWWVFIHGEQHMRRLWAQESGLGP